MIEKQRMKAHLQPQFRKRNYQCAKCLASERAAQKSGQLSAKLHALKSTNREHNTYPQFQKEHKTKQAKL
jgi:hypothetical protein